MRDSVLASEWSNFPSWGGFYNMISLIRTGNSSTPPAVGQTPARTQEIPPRIPHEPRTEKFPKTVGTGVWAHTKYAALGAPSAHARFACKVFVGGDFFPKGIKGETSGKALFFNSAGLILKGAERAQFKTAKYLSNIKVFGDHRNRFRKP